MIIRTLFLLIFSVMFTSCASKPNTSKSNIISAVDYYHNWSGHEVSHLEKVYNGLKKNGCEIFIYYAGDSSLDNKAWILSQTESSDPKNYYNDQRTAAAINGYEKILTPQRMVKDVDYWMNYFLTSKDYLDKKICSIMTSVEASTLGQRKQELKPQDIFIKNHITSNDFLIVSVGGNDVALDPADEVSLAVRSLSTDPNNQGALKIILSIIKDDTQRYIERLIEKEKPKKILVSMIYYPDENNITGFAEGTLRAFKYEKNPNILQEFIDKIYQLGTKQINISGTNVIPIQLSEVLNGKDSSDYVNSVEPSALGGKKMAKFFLEKLFSN